MREQKEGILQLRSHIRNFLMQGTNGPQHIEMLVIFVDCVMHVSALEGWLHIIWPN
jgi:hypothetical protein